MSTSRTVLGKMLAPTLTLAFVLMGAGRADAAPRIRKNYSTLSQTEKDQFVDACLRLRGTNSTFNNAGLLNWDDFVRAHIAKMDFAHGGPAFLAWHREFLLLFEDALRATNPPATDDVTIPYWDWTKDLTGNDANGDGFPDDLESFIGGNGDPLDNDIVKTGPFAYLTGNWTIDLPISTPKELQRHFNSLGGYLPTVPDVTSVLGLDLFDTDPWNASSGATSFRNTLEGLHGLVHVWIGGDMGFIDTAPNDPLFFMHHANVDRLWCRWQEKYPFAFHHLPSGPGLHNLCYVAPNPVGSQPLSGHYACDIMEPFGERPVDLLNIKALDYRYDDCQQGPCVFQSDAAPQYQGLTLSQVMILYGV